MTFRKLLLIGLIGSIFSGNSALACRDPSSETQTFLNALPKDATSKDVVGEIIILKTEIEKDSFQRISLVKVITPIKGLQAGQEFSVLSEIHSCAKDSDVKNRERYFIAGKFNPEGKFYGLWEGFLNNLKWEESQ